ncbi:protein c-Fos-like [Lineus longissimus]|uniref:protein c-Fos-like n=1 Tax=Lineus longissimus TaxID=88925 RepID=UPI00315CF336
MDLHNHHHPRINPHFIKDEGSGLSAIPVPLGMPMQYENIKHENIKTEEIYSAVNAENTCPILNPAVTPSSIVKHKETVETRTPNVKTERNIEDLGYWCDTPPKRMKKTDYSSAEQAERMELRKKRNREAAAKCRQRKEQRRQELEEQVARLETELNERTDEVDGLKQQVDHLQTLLCLHAPTCKIKVEGE